MSAFATDTETAGLASRVAHLEAVAAIEQLVARYNLALDDGNLDAVMDLFTEDARFSSAERQVALEGRAEIRTFFERMLAGRGPSLHAGHSHVIELVDADFAVGILQVSSVLDRHGETVNLGIRYHDEYRRAGGAWRLAVRTAAVVFAHTQPAAASPFGDDYRERWGEAPAGHALPTAATTLRHIWGDRA